MNIDSGTTFRKHSVYQTYFLFEKKAPTLSNPQGTKLLRTNQFLTRDYFDDHLQQSLDQLSDTLSIQFQSIQTLIQNIGGSPSSNSPFRFQTSLASNVQLGIDIKPEYRAYIQKYGLPRDGIWDPQLLIEFL